MAVSISAEWQAAQHVTGVPDSPCAHCSVSSGLQYWLEECRGICNWFEVCFSKQLWGPACTASVWHAYAAQVNAEAQKIGKEADEANAIAAECQAGLDRALPALQAAEDALNVLTKKDMSELKVQFPESLRLGTCHLTALWVDFERVGSLPLEQKVCQLQQQQHLASVSQSEFRIQFVWQCPAAQQLQQVSRAWLQHNATLTGGKLPAVAAAAAGQCQVLHPRESSCYLA